LGVVQRLRLGLLWLGAFARRRLEGAVPATREMITTIPRSTEEATAAVNYQLNMIGLQTEQWMTDTWAGYLRRRQKWMRGASGKKAPAKKRVAKGGGKAGGGDSYQASWVQEVGHWWDDRVVSTKRAWVSFQIDSAKQGKAGSKPAGKAAPKAGEKKRGENASSDKDKKAKPSVPTSKPKRAPTTAPAEVTAGADDADNAHAAASPAFAWMSWRPVSKSSFGGHQEAAEEATEEEEEESGALAKQAEELEQAQEEELDDTHQVDEEQEAQPAWWRFGSGAMVEDGERAHVSSEVQGEHDAEPNRNAGPGAQ